MEPRRLQRWSNIFEGEDRSAAGFTTEYLIFMVCVATVLLVARREREKTSSAESWFMLFGSLHGLAFLSAGISHTLLFTYTSNGQVPTVWNGENSMWLFWWFFAILFFSLGCGATLAVACAFCEGVAPRAGTRQLLSRMCMLPGVLVAAFELRRIYDGATLYSGSEASICNLLAAAVATIVLLVDVCCRGSGGGRVAASIGMLVGVLGWTIENTTPPSCNYDGPAHEGCVYPEVFNQNAFFHVLICLDVVLMYHSITLKIQESDSRVLLWAQFQESETGEE